MNEIQQPVRSPVSSAITVPRVVAIFVLVFGVTALAVRCVAIASQSPHGSASADHSGHSAVVAGPPLTLEQLGAKAGCHPKVQTNAAELRQGYCTTASGRFFLTTFATAQGQQAWLEQAKDYGEVLIGNRWAVGASPQVLTQLRAKLGGEIYGHAHGQGHA
ncbi:MAG TPA: hypothetical protein VF069_26460 [Streptosporangiaceae bacterium]